MPPPEFRLLQFHHTVPTHELDFLRKSGHFDRYVHDLASRALANEMVKAEVLRNETREPAPDDPWGGTRTEFRWTVGVMVAKDAAGFQRQLRDARAEGMRLAAAICRERGAVHDPTNRPCGHVLKSSLDDTARAIEERASRLEP